MARSKIKRKWRLGVVSYLNAQPLIAGLEDQPDIELIHRVPSALPPLLEAGQVDVALVPVIDLPASGRVWRIVSDACIGSDGETLTVRVFSQVEPASIRTLWGDGHSHTSIALARIIWKEQYGRSLEVVPLSENERIDEQEAVLLIGDKVVHADRTAYAYEMDLGQAWRSLTSLPFVFAAWAAVDGMNVSALATRLSEARDRGVASISTIAAHAGPARGWPVPLAERYLTEHLQFTDRKSVV